MLCHLTFLKNLQNKLQLKNSNLFKKAITNKMLWCEYVRTGAKETRPDLDKFHDSAKKIQDFEK